MCLNNSITFIQMEGFTLDRASFSLLIICESSDYVFKLFLKKNKSRGNNIKVCSIFLQQLLDLLMP